MLKKMHRQRIAVTLRYFLIFFITINLLVLALPSVKADTKDIPELKRRATRDGVPAEMLAASFALVSAYNILNEPLGELDELVLSTRKDGKEAEELKRALKEAREGKFISVCRESKEIDPYLGRLTIEELARKARNAASSKTRQSAAEALLEKIVQSVGIDFISYYQFRIDYEVKFDQIKKEVTFLSTDSLVSDWAQSKRKELVEEVFYLLGRMYLAEYLITLKSSFVRDKVNCKSEDEDNGEGL